MNTRNPYPDLEIPDISPPEFVPDRADVRGAAVPLMGPADHASTSPLMGPANAGTITPLMGPAAPATVTPLLGPADRGTMVPLMGPADQRRRRTQPVHGRLHDQRAVRPRRVADQVMVEQFTQLR
jgi:hypothetical protein